MHISEFQAMMQCIYFHKDSERGIKGTYDWLLDEVRELGEALETDDKEIVRNEFADVLAWLSSLANIAGIDVEEAALTKYCHKCPKCRSSPCCGTL